MRCAAESASRHISALGFGPLDRFERRRGNVNDALVGRGRPLSAEIVTLAAWVEMIVGQCIPGAKRCMVIADASNVEIVGIDILFAEWRFLDAVWPAAGQCRGGYGAKKQQTNTRAPFHKTVFRLTEYRRRNDHAHSQNDRGADNGGSDVSVLQDLFAEVARRALIKEFVSKNRRGDADEGE